MSKPQVNLLQEQLKTAHQFLQGTMQGVTDEVVHWQPGGLASPIAAHFAHLVVIEDAIVNGILKGGTPLFMSGYEGQTGLNELPPLPSPAKEGLPNWHEWSHQLRLDLETAHTYAQAVHAATDSYLDTLPESELKRPVKTALGETTVAGLLSTALSNCQWHTGEIACIKGLQGLQGYMI